MRGLAVRRISCSEISNMCVALWWKTWNRQRYLHLWKTWLHSGVNALIDEGRRPRTQTFPVLIPFCGQKNFKLGLQYWWTVWYLNLPDSFQSSSFKNKSVNLFVVNCVTQQNWFVNGSKIAHVIIYLWVEFIIDWYIYSWDVEVESFFVSANKVSNVPLCVDIKRDGISRVNQVLYCHKGFHMYRNSTRFFLKVRLIQCGTRAH